MKRTKKIKILLLFLFVIWHIFAISIYNSGSKYTPRFVNNVAGYYVYPLFNQWFRMFAPEPPLYDMKLYCRYKKNGNWSKWVDPGKKHLLNYIRNPFSTNGLKYNIQDKLTRELYYMISDSLRKETPFGKNTSVKLKGNFNDDNRYKQAKKYVLQQINRQKDITKIQIAYVSVFTNFNSEKETDKYIFPPDKITND